MGVDSVVMEAVGISDGGADGGTIPDVDVDAGTPRAPGAGVDDAGPDVDGGDGGVRASWSCSPAMMVSPGPGTFGGIRLLSELQHLFMLTSKGWPAPWATLRAFPGAGGVPDPPAS